MSLARTVTYTYTPDKLSRSSMTDINPFGEVTNYSSNALNQYTSTAGNSYSYDSNFNLTHVAGFSGVYDAANHLVSAAGGSSGESQQTVAGFVYDGLGRCVKRTLNGVATVFVFDGWKPIAEWDEYENLQAWNVYGPGADEILLRYRVPYGYIRFQLDRHGNVAFLLDNDGREIEKYTYDAFGRPTVTDWDGGRPRSWSFYGHCFLFQGREYIRELGIYDYRNRFYYPALGRFLQSDPMGFGAGDMNFFRYVGDDPIDKSDPTGLLDTMATIWNRLAWFEGGSPFSSHGDDLLKQGQAKFAEPTGNYKDSNVDHHFPDKSTPIKSTQAGVTRYTVSDIQETDTFLLIKPTLDWWVRPQYKATTVVKSELEHVSRWLYWQQTGDGAAAVHSFNRNPTGIGSLRQKMENARFSESIWQGQNIHGVPNRHDLTKFPEKAMDPADIRKLIENVGPVEEPYLGR